VVTVALALGARRMARRSAVVRQLPAVETLGAVTVVAADNTGTLTEGVMLAERFWTEQAEYFAEGNGYDPGGSLSRIGEQVAVDDSADRLLRAVVLCNDAELRAPDPDHPD
jgi:Ca2+-transporting ATPase